MEESYSYEYENDEFGIGGLTENFEILEENYMEEEHGEHSEEYYEDIISDHYSSDGSQIDLKDKIKHIETLRAQIDKTLNRKNNMMITLVDLYEEGVVSGLSL